MNFCVRALIFQKQMIFPSVQSYVIVIHFSDARSAVKTSWTRTMKDSASVGNVSLAAGTNHDITGDLQNPRYVKPKRLILNVTDLILCMFQFVFLMKISLPTTRGINRNNLRLNTDQRIGEVGGDILEYSLLKLFTLVTKLSWISEESLLWLSWVLLQQ